MLVALIVAGITLLVAIVVILVAFLIMRNRKSSNVSLSKPVRTLDPGALAAGAGKGPGVVAGSSGSRASAAQDTATNPAGNLKSRVLAMNVLVALVFGSLAAKVWSMQVLSANAYRRESEENRYSIVYTPAPRGLILDSDGIELVGNRSSLTVLADGDVADDPDVIARLSAVLGVPRNVIRSRVKDQTSGAQSQRIVSSDADMRQIAFIAEHSDGFPGISVQTRSVRSYPYRALAAHVVGYTGATTEDDLASIPQGRDIKTGDEVGRSGVEAMYDNLIAGDHGVRKVIADASGNVVSVESEQQPTRGSDVYLTIKAPVQYVCDKALASLIAPKEGTIGTGLGTAGAIVVMDVNTGGIIAMSSFPTFAPETFIGGIEEDTWELYQTEESRYPMLNRVIQGTYPAASTYKAFTGLAALAHGFADKEKKWECTGAWDGWESGDVQMCWNHAGHGELDFRGAIVNSCDVAFYEMAKQFFDESPLSGGSKQTVSETAMQDYIKKYHFGELTGIDLTGETEGRVPTPEWKKEYFRDYPEDSAWKGGDSTNMVIGQGYVLITPIQLAVAYGAIATGKIVKPHILQEVRNANGDVAISVKTEFIDEPDVPQEHLEMLRDALNGVAVENAEIAAVFAKHGVDAHEVACKTGTAEVAGKDDFGWFTCYYPYKEPRYVLAVVVEEGGGGSSAGAPLGAEVTGALKSYEAGELSEVAAIAGSTGKAVEYKGASGGRTD